MSTRVQRRSAQLHSLMSVTKHNQYLRISMAAMYAHPELVLNGSRPLFQEDGWSMQTNMVGRNAEAFNEAMQDPNGMTTSWCCTLDDYAPISWRKTEHEDVNGEEIDGVYYPSTIELVY